MHFLGVDIDPDNLGRKRQLEHAGRLRAELRADNEKQIGLAQTVDRLRCLLPRARQ